VHRIGCGSSLIACACCSSTPVQHFSSVQPSRGVLLSRPRPAASQEVGLSHHRWFTCAPRPFAHLTSLLGSLCSGLASNRDQSRRCRRVPALALISVDVELRCGQPITCPRATTRLNKPNEGGEQLASPQTREKSSMRALIERSLAKKSGLPDVNESVESTLTVDAKSLAHRPAPVFARARTSAGSHLRSCMRPELGRVLQ
jgi:hypothetical protein